MAENPELDSRNDLAEAAKIRYLTPSNTEFSRTKGHMLSAQVNGEVYPVVYLHCSFPHSNKKIYVSVRTLENEEIGMIKAIDDFSKGIVEILEDHIKLRYFAPEITKVINIEEEFGYSYWVTETSAGRVRFTVRTNGGNVKLVTNNKLLITDVDGNRFVIEQLDGLPDKEYKMVEMCLA